METSAMLYSFKMRDDCCDFLVYLSCLYCIMGFLVNKLKE